MADTIKLSKHRALNVLRYVGPSILANIAYFLFTIVDGIFVGNGVGVDALGAINIAFPYVMVANALIVLTSVGGSTIIAIHIGEQDTEGANTAFRHALFAGVTIAAILAVIGIFFPGSVVRLLGAGDTFYAYAKDYIFWISIFYIPIALGIAINNFCRNDGAPVLVSVAVIIGTALNIFGDWLCVFPLQMGIKGAAIATGVSQTISMLIVASHILRQKGVLQLRPDNALKFKPRLIGEILYRGLPQSIAEFGFPVATVVSNWIIAKYVGDIGINAFSILSYVGSFSCAFIYATAEGLQPLFGMCYGAREGRDLKYYLRAGLIINLIGTGLITVFLHVLGTDIAALFGADAPTMTLVNATMTIFASGFVCLSITGLISAYFYSTKRSMLATIISFLRAFVLDVLVILMLPLLFGANAVWYNLPVYEGIAMIIAVVMLLMSERQGIRYI